MYDIHHHHHCQYLERGNPMNVLTPRELAASYAEGGPGLEQLRDWLTVDRWRDEDDQPFLDAMDDGIAWHDDGHIDDNELREWTGRLLRDV
jgi:hypothetical protein